MVGNHPYSALNEACVLGRASEKLWSVGKFQEATGRRVISVSVGFHFLARRGKLPSPNLLEIKKSNFFRNSSQILPKKSSEQNQRRKLFGNFNNILLYIHLFGNLFLAKIMESKGAPPPPPVPFPPHPRNKAVLRDCITNHHHPLKCWHWWIPLDFHGKKGVGPTSWSFMVPTAQRTVLLHQIYLPAMGGIHKIQFFLRCAHWKGEVSNTIIKSCCPRTYDFQVPTDYTGTPSLSGGWQGSTLQVAIRAPSKNWMIKKYGHRSVHC